MIGWRRVGEPLVQGTMEVEFSWLGECFKRKRLKTTSPRMREATPTPPKLVCLKAEDRERGRERETVHFHF